MYLFADYAELYTDIKSEQDELVLQKILTFVGWTDK